MSTDHDAEREQLDAATARRLAKLRTMPVDTHRLEQMIRAQIPAAGDAGRDAKRGRSFRTWTRPVRAAAAAAVLLAATLTLVVINSGGPALASTDQMIRMHQDLVAGRVPVEQVDSIEAANRVLTAQSPRCPELPQITDGEPAVQPEAHVMACCLKSVRNKNVACVLLKSEGVPVTMAVADADELRSPASPNVTRNGVSYHAESSGSLNMVTTKRDGRLVCLIGELPTERLMDLASQLKF